MTKFDEEVKTALIKLGLWNESLINEDDELWCFMRGERLYMYLRKDNGKEMDSLCLLSDTIKFPDDVIPKIYFAAADVNNHHTSARVAIHSHLFEGHGEIEENFVGLEFHVPRLLISDFQKAIEIGMDQLDTLYEEWNNVLECQFG